MVLWPRTQKCQALTASPASIGPPASRRRCLKQVPTHFLAPVEVGAVMGLPSLVALQLLTLQLARPYLAGTRGSGYGRRATDTLTCR